MASTVSDEVGTQLLEESVSMQTALMADTKANIQHVSSIARAAGVKKFDQIGPLESAAASVVLRIKPLSS